LRRNCLLKHIIQGKIDSKGRGGRRHKLLLNDLKEKRRYRNFKEETILTIKPTRCTNFSNLFLEYNFTCFGEVFSPSPAV